MVRKQLTAGMVWLLAATGLVSALQAPGTWQKVSPAGMTAGYGGVQWIMGDPVRPSDVYVFPNYVSDVWKSTDFGVTFTKISTGLPSGARWSGAIDLNPHRNPATPPTMYMPSGYGSQCCWKSVDGGMTWTNVWLNNVYSSDGTDSLPTDHNSTLSTVVGSDVGNMKIVDSLDCNHVILHLHSTTAPQEYNGVFETTNGGVSWRAAPPQTHFAFSNHGDQLFNIGSCWFVGHMTTYPNSEVWRTSDRGATWTDAGPVNTIQIGRVVCTVGSIVYATGSQSGIYKSTDNGLSWAKSNYVGSPSWIAATPAKIYAQNGNDGTILVADARNDAVWSAQATPGPSNSAAFAPVVTFDGTNYIVVAAQGDSNGVWRYVEPASVTGAGALSARPAAVKNRGVTRSVEAGRMTLVKSASPRGSADNPTGTFDIRGVLIGRADVQRSSR